MNVEQYSETIPFECKYKPIFYYKNLDNYSLTSIMAAEKYLATDSS